MSEPRSVRLSCADGVSLGGELWAPPGNRRLGRVIINPATGVLARYYHRYAQFLAAHGFSVLTYDYRGIGASRPQRLRGCGYRWSDWGELDFEAALGFMRDLDADGPLLVVGHSIGGFLPGLAPSAGMIERMLSVGAQYAYWPDYARKARTRMFLKWHLFMPAVTALCGYFPGKRLGWLEDLPAGVANEWSFRRARMELSHAPERRDIILGRFAAVKAQILAVAVSDDEYGTPRAIARGLAYYRNARKTDVLLRPADYGLEQIGHFGLFHSRHQAGFWLDTLLWLRDAVNPWPGRPFGAETGAAHPSDICGAGLSPAGRTS
ncbi:alpha/beta hydrolase family protein [Rhodoligotrophos defluvii]|uniref:alpha/beta hydrolase family protein n=1 Tax=Rhodoligotrophos defluvii TaxID=2561934 RepID=UPI0010C9E1C6|nr:alpha/beta fold hydrolase [Rhodoligotrophos defluvii]